MTLLSPHSKAWSLRKEKILQVLGDFSQKSPAMSLLSFEDTGDEVRGIVQFETETLVKLPGQDVQLAGPVVAGIRYHHLFQSQAPVPWELVTILFPMAVYHPNVNAGGGLCLGHPAANVPMDLILHMTWAALVLNTRLVTTTDWNVFNREAAAFVRQHKGRFPLTERGLLEAVPLPAAVSQTAVQNPTAPTPPKEEAQS